MSDFGSMLRHARENADWTQMKLGKAAGGVSYSVISRWETGERSPQTSDRDHIIKIANALNMTYNQTDELLTAAGLKPLSIDAIDVDKELANLQSDLGKVKFLCEVKRWDNSQIGKKLDLTWFEVATYIRAIKKAEQELRAKPTWIDPFAAAIRDKIQVPYPTKLLVTDIRHGSVPVQDRNGCTAGCFYWDWDIKKEEPAVRLYDHRNDSCLEDDPQFDKFMERRPEIKVSLDAYRQQAKEFIVSADRLLTCVVTMAGQMVSEFLRRRGYDVEPPLPDFRDSKSVFQRSSSDNPVEMVVYQDFVHEAYREALRQSSERVYGQPDGTKYKYKTTPVKGDTCALSFGPRLAEGPAGDIEELQQAHKKLIEEFVTRQSSLIENVLKAGLETWKSAEKLRDQL